MRLQDRALLYIKGRMITCWRTRAAAPVERARARLIVLSLVPAPRLGLLPARTPARAPRPPAARSGISQRGASPRPYRRLGWRFIGTALWSRRSNSRWPSLKHRRHSGSSSQSAHRNTASP